MPIVIDTNIWISSLISASLRERLHAIILRKEIEIIGSNNLILELEKVVERSKIRKYITNTQAIEFTDIIKERLDLVSPESIIQISRDPNDDYLLPVCRDGRVDYLITGDKDLLIIHPFENTAIITLTEFEQVLNNTNF